MRRQARITPFGKSIKKRLIDKSMTQVELAIMIGTTPQYLQKIIYGERSGRKYIDHICRVLEIKNFEDFY